VFTDRASGSLDRRPQLDRALDQLRPGSTLVVPIGEVRASALSDYAPEAFS